MSNQPGIPGKAVEDGLCVLKKVARGIKFNHSALNKFWG